MVNGPISGTEDAKMASGSGLDGNALWQPPPGVYNAAVDMVDRNVREGRADKVAFIDPDRRLTYGALLERGNRFASALRRLGIAREQRIALIMLDTMDMPVAFWGAIKAGVVPIPVNTLLSGEQWKYVLVDSRAAAVVISRDLLDRATPMLEEIGHDHSLQVIVSGGDGNGHATFEALLADGDVTAPPADTRADEVAFWLYSSGSTGVPKGTRHVHASPMHTAKLYAQGVLGLREDDVIFSAAKLFFAYGLGNGMSFPQSVGATTILLPGRPTPDSVAEVMATHNPTIFCGVPTLFAAMLAGTTLSHGAGSSRLRFSLSAGEALPEDIGLRWQARVGTEIIDGIGSTEMLHIFVSNRPGKVRYGSSGLPVPGYDALILDEEGKPVVRGDIGELVVRGPSAADGYWLQREKSRRTFRGEWTYTGDKYRMGDDGLYYYCGRTDDMFKVSGVWVSPFEVESVLITHACVLEAAVVAKADAEGLLKPKAFIVFKPGVEPSESLTSELRAHVQTIAGPWKYPRWIEARTELPKTATGKIQRFKLRD